MRVTIDIDIPNCRGCPFYKEDSGKYNANYCSRLGHYFVCDSTIKDASVIQEWCPLKTEEIK